MGFFSRHRKAFKSVIASFGMLFGLLAGVSVTTNVAYANFSGSLNGDLSSLITISEKSGFTVSKDATWIVGDDSISGKVTGLGILGPAGDQKGTLNIKNIGGVELEISFGWNFSTTGGHVQFGSEGKITSNSSGNKTISLAKSKTFSVELMAERKLRDSFLSIHTIKAISKSAKPQITFLPSENGTYSVDGTKVENEAYKPTPKFAYVGYELKATPKAGFYFDGWQVLYGSESKICGVSDAYLLRETISCSVKALFTSESNKALFRNGTKYFGDLDEAVQSAFESKADKVVVVEKNGEIAKKNYIIPAGITLMIPCQDGTIASEFATGQPKFVNAAEPRSLYRALTLPANSSLTINGTLIVACKILLKGPSDTGIPTGSYGQLILKEASSIMLQNGGKLYCWGFATGDGQVLAKSGATVYEMFQIATWRGGTTSLSMNGNGQKVFMVNQYYIQNVECLLRLDAGSVLKTTTGMYMSKDVAVGVAGGSTETCFTFIGDGGMFKLSSGYLTKKYNPSLDRLEIDVSGKGTLSGIAFVVELIGQKVDMDSSKYVLPINGNITFNFRTGSDVLANQDLGFLPGSVVNIESGANFGIDTNHNVVFYDADNWGNYSFGAPFRAVTFTPTPHKNRTSADLIDAKLAIDGTLTVGNGAYLMTTGEKITGNDADDEKTKAKTIGARIISPRRTGVIKFTDATANSLPEVYQYDENSSPKYVSIVHSCAKLQNGDHSYTQSVPGNTYNYDKVLDRWSLSTEHATKTGLFKTIDNSGVIKTVLLENDVMSTGRSGLFHYSSKTYKAGDNHYYYLQTGVVVNNKEWYQEGGKWYFFGTNQYAYQNMSAVFTASTGIAGFGIQARYFFNNAATVERLVTVSNVVGLSRDITIGTIGSDSYCYYKSVKAGIGLFEKQSGSNYSVYLAKDDGSLMADGTYYVPSHKINSIKDSSGKVLTAGLYYFDANGHMYDSNFKVITRGNAS